MFAKALDATRKYLQAMGAKVASSKSYNFASNQKTARLRNRTWWKHIDAKIEVVKDFRYLRAHLTTKSTASSPTITKRWGEAMQPLKKLKFRPATVEAKAKAKAILVKVYAAAFYGIDAADPPAARIA